MNKIYWYLLLLIQFHITMISLYGTKKEDTQKLLKDSVSYTNDFIVLEDIDLDSFGSEESSVVNDIIIFGTTNCRWHISILKFLLLSYPTAGGVGLSTVISKLTPSLSLSSFTQKDSKSSTKLTWKVAGYYFLFASRSNGLLWEYSMSTRMKHFIIAWSYLWDMTFKMALILLRSLLSGEAVVCQIIACVVQKRSSHINIHLDAICFPTALSENVIYAFKPLRCIVLTSKTEIKAIQQFRRYSHSLLHFSRRGQQRIPIQLLQRVCNRF